MKYSFFIASLTCAFILFSCGEPKAEPETDLNILKADERDLCASQNIDSTLILLLRETSRAKLDVFLPDSVYTFDSADNWISRASNLQGVMFEATSGQAAALCDEYGDDFNTKGHTIYVFEQNFGIDSEKDKVAIVNTSDKYEILRETATDGINYDIDNDSVITIIKTFDAKYDLILTGCGLDWCQFNIGKAPSDWEMMAKEVYDVCPDVVDQGTGSVEDLAKELEEFKTLYLWWD